MAKSNGKSRPLDQQIVDRLDALADRMDAGLEVLHQDNLDTGRPLDRLVETLSGYWRDHEARLRAIEEKLGLSP